MHELEQTERELKQKARELANHQAQEVQTLEIKQKEMNVNLETARKSMEELKRRHDAEKKELADKQDRLDKMRAEIATLRQLAEKHANERDQLMQRLRDLDDKSIQEKRRAEELSKEETKLQQGINANKHNLSQEEAALKDREQLVQVRTEEKKKIETHAKEQITNEEIALKKAQDLSSKAEKERRDIQKDLTDLVAKEQEAKKCCAEMDKNVHVKIEERPATVDVFKRERYETKEPVVTEAHVDKKWAPCAEDKSLGEKIIDGVKNIF